LLGDHTPHFAGPRLPAKFVYRLARVHWVTFRMAAAILRASQITAEVSGGQSRRGENHGGS
jgi:hypothetical protein